MITSFFKPSSQKKVERALSNNVNVVVENDKKRTFSELAEDAKENDASPKRGRVLLLNEKSLAVHDLLSCLESPPTDSNKELSWKGVLSKHFSTPSFANLAHFVSMQRKSATIYPPVSDTFSALNLTPLDQVKVVVVGQDPYHGPNQAHGLCFSVHKGVRIPPSLRNIYKELQDDPDIEEFTRMPTHGNLQRWTKQGVLMINTVLTVKQGVANSHKGKGWEEVTDEIIRAVDRRAKKDGRGVVFLLWGKPATSKCETALGGVKASSSLHTIICTSHPSPLGATKTSAPFMGSKCFSRANAALRDMGYDAIDWRVDGDL